MKQVMGLTNVPEPIENLVSIIKDLNVNVREERV